VLEIAQLWKWITDHKAVSFLAGTLMVISLAVIAQAREVTPQYLLGLTIVVVFATALLAIARAAWENGSAGPVASIILVGVGVGLLALGAAGIGAAVFSSPCQFRLTLEAIDFLPEIQGDNCPRPPEIEATDDQERGIGDVFRLDVTDTVVGLLHSDAQVSVDLFRVSDDRLVPSPRTVRVRVRDREGLPLEASQQMEVLGLPQTVQLPPMTPETDRVSVELDIVHRRVGRGTLSLGIGEPLGTSVEADALVFTDSLDFERLVPEGWRNQPYYVLRDSILDLGEGVRRGEEFVFTIADEAHRGSYRSATVLMTPRVEQVYRGMYGLHRFLTPAPWQGEEEIPEPTQDVGSEPGVIPIGTEFFLVEWLDSRRLRVSRVESSCRPAPLAFVESVTPFGDTLRADDLEEKEREGTVALDGGYTSYSHYRSRLENIGIDVSDDCGANGRSCRGSLSIAGDDTPGVAIFWNVFDGDLGPRDPFPAVYPVDRWGPVPTFLRADLSDTLPELEIERCTAAG